MTFAQTLSDRVRSKAIRDAIYSSLYGCVPEAVVDSGAIIVVYIALLGGGDASRMFATSLTALAHVLFLLPAAKTAELCGLKRQTTLACATTTAAFLVMAAAPFFGPAALPILLAALFVYCVSRPFDLATWYPMLDNFLRPQDRSGYFGKMRFLYSSLNALLLFVVGRLVGKDPPVWLLQAIVGVFGLAAMGRAYHMCRLPLSPLPDSAGPGRQTLPLAEGLRTSLRNSPLVGFSIYFCMVNISLMAFIPLAIVYLRSGLVPDVPEGAIISISALTLVGNLVGFLSASRVIRIVGKKLLILLVHLLFIVLIGAVALCPAGLHGAKFAIGAALFAASYLNSVLGVLNSVEMMALARPGNKTVAMAFAGVLGNLGAAIGRSLPSVALAMGVFAPSFPVAGMLANHFQTLFGVQAVLLTVCLVLLLQLPEFVPHHEDYYEP